MFVLLFKVTLFAMGKNGQTPVEQGTVVTPILSTGQQQRTMIKELLENPTKYSSSEVLLDGFFKGWKGTCSSSFMLTRSDWILEDETGCIYVTGTLPIGFSPMQPHNESVTVTGHIIVDKKGRLSIKITQSDRRSH